MSYTVTKGWGDRAWTSDSPALILGGQTFVNVVKVINIGQKFNLLKRTGGKIWQTIFPCKNVG